MDRNESTPGLDDGAVPRQPEAMRDACGRSEETTAVRYDLQNRDELAMGVVHDLNNFLQVIGNCLELLDRRIDDVSGARRLNGAARQALARATDLSRRLLALSSGCELPLEVLRLNELEATMGDVLRRALPDTIGLAIRHASPLWRCATDACLLEAALLNLSINARDAMPDGGTLTIDVANRAVDGAQAAAWGSRRATSSSCR